MKSFNFFQDTKLVFGAGKVEEAGKIIKAYGNTCLLVSTPVRKERQALYDRVISILEKAAIKVVHFDGIQPNPTTDDITNGAELAKRVGAEVIVGLGGGSSMDAAKAIAVEATHEGSSWDYLFFKKQPTQKTLPIITISTTSGTGSQVTQVAVITNTANRDKSALYNNILYPKVAIIDPALMTTVPRFVTACTGFDVFCHAFESLIHPGRGAYVELLAKEAIQKVKTYLPKVLADPEDIEARSELAWADTMAGLCIANAGVTLPHGMGMAIGGMYPHVAHGQALAIVYPACIDYTWEHSIEQHAFLSRTLNSEINGAKNYEAAKEAPTTIRSFLQMIDLNHTLQKVNMPKNEIESLAKQSLVLPDYQNNPRVANLEDMLDLVKASW